MEFVVNEISQSEKEVEVTLNYDEIKNEIDDEIKKQARNIEVPGFRKGKVPTNILRQRYGNALEIEASENVANARFWQIAKENDLRPVGQPIMTDIDFNPEKDFKFKVKYEVVPEIEVKDYKDQLIEVPDIKVKPEEVDNEINKILRSNSIEETAEVVGDDENFLLDVELTRLNDEGNPDEKTKPEKMQIDLSNKNVHPDIKNNAKGKKVGDKFKFHFHDEKTVTNKEGQEETITEHFDYEVLINGIKKIQLPELNEELIKKVTKDKISTESELRNAIEKDITNYYDQRVEEYTRNVLVGTIIKNNDFTPPASLVESVLTELVKNEEERLKNQGMKKVDTKYLREYLKPSALNEVKWYQIKSEILKKENLKVTDDELEELAKADSEKTSLPVEKLMNFYKTSNQTERMLDNKLFNFLKMNNEIKRVDPDQQTKRKKNEK
ncbi:MAG: trigger factor [Ignavibacteriaceae bacterium]